MATRLSRLAAAVLVAIAFAVSPAIHAQTAAPEKAPAQNPSAQKPVVKSKPVNVIRSVEGKDNFEAYCAVCHGQDAKGTGPAAPAMKTPVPDLTMIAKRHGGKFDAVAIQRIIKGSDKTLATPAHGVETMPIWGDVFRGSEDPSVTTGRVNNLVDYLKSIQVQ